MRDVLALPSLALAGRSMRRFAGNSACGHGRDVGQLHEVESRTKCRICSGVVEEMSACWRSIHSSLAQHQPICALRGTLLANTEPAARSEELRVGKRARG